MNGREVTSDLDCADCLCAVCARSAHTSMDNEKLSYYDKDFERDLQRYAKKKYKLSKIKGANK